MNRRPAPSCRRLGSSGDADDVVGHAFSHGIHPQHVERLTAYWAEALGGPSTYSDSYGDETTVVKMHSGNGGARRNRSYRMVAGIECAASLF